MPTTKEVIERALKRIHVLDSDSELSATDLEDCLAYANEMIEAWSIEHLLIPGRTLESFTAVAAGGNMFLMGSGGDLNTTAPILIDAINGIGADGSDYVISPATAQDWLGIEVRNAIARPNWWYAEYTSPLVRIRFDKIPLPTESLRILSWKPLSALPALTADIDVPTAYARALRLNFAVEFAGEFDVPVSNDLRFEAEQAKDALKRKNYQPATLSIDPAISRHRRGSDLELWTSP